ncbi:protein maelstrom homolog [Liolophura sinensis]|uniref:protein maelstrom homolog n=1 Tax=Liolophura sinensis TaxID=3198878 RepID=UPI0031589632
MDESFFLINIQTLCETEEGDFLPCEIACLEFSLAKGIIKTFHKFIDPGELTHQIPDENFDKVHIHYSWMWTQLKNFVKPNREKDVYPPVYCRPSVYRETKKCLEWLHFMAMDRGTCKLGRVLNLEGLLMDLYNHIGQTISHSEVVNILGTTSYDFTPNHLCEYHEGLECKYCSLGIIRRYAFVMFDELYEVYPFELTPQHLPERPEGDLEVTVIPPPKESIFPGPSVNRGQMSYSELARKGGNQDRGDGMFTSRDYRYTRQFETSDSDEERHERKDATSLRLPKAPGGNN